MDVPAITSAGKPCKLCKAKQKEGRGRCHLHGGSPLKGGCLPTKTKVSKRKASPSSSPKFYYVESLPKPALQNILLKMDWIELSRVLPNKVPNVRKVTNNRNFQEKYLTLHPFIFLRAAITYTWNLRTIPVQN